MMRTVTEKVGHWIDEAITQHGQGENILWEAALLPHPQTGTPLYTVFVWVPGALLGTTLNGSFQIEDVLGITKDKIDETLTQMLEQFRVARSQMLTHAEQEAAAASQQPQTASGLVLPHR